MPTAIGWGEIGATAMEGARSEVSDDVVQVRKKLTEE
jgi:hypothetical protein